MNPKNPSVAGLLPLTLTRSQCLRALCVGFSLVVPTLLFAATSASFEAENLTVAASAGSTTVVNADAGASGGNWVQLNAAGVGEYMEFTTGTIAAGTYTIQLDYKANTNRGQFSLAVDGVTVASAVDQYAATVAWPTANVGRVTFSTTGTHVLRMTVTGKNGASSGYLLSADAFGFIAQNPTSVLFEAENLALTTSAGSTASVNTDTLASGGSWVQLNATGTGEYVQFRTGDIIAGTYSVQLGYKANNNRGKLAVTIDGATVGSGVDQYASAVAWPTATIGTVTFSTSGTHLVRLTVTGKNAASTGYLLSADVFHFNVATPAAPTGLSATATSSSQINLSWTASPGAPSYNVKRGATSGGLYTTIATGVTTTTYSNTGLSAGTAYYYVVSAVNSVGESANSAQATATTVVAPPAAPTGVSATATSNTQINLSWTASTGATSYSVKRSATSGGPYATIATGVTVTSYSNTGLSAGTTYYYVVSAVNAGGESGNSAQATATTQSPTSVSFETENLVVTTSTGSSTSINTDTQASGGSWVQLNSGAVGEYMEFTTGVINAGTYNVQLVLKANTNRGELAVAIDGTTVGAVIDEYAATVLWSTATIGTVTFSTPGTHQVRLTVTGKNAASTGYLLSADALNFVVTSGTASFPAGLAVTPYLIGQNDWNPLPNNSWPTIMDSGVKHMRIGGHTYDTTPPSNAWYLSQVDYIRSIGAEPTIQVSRFFDAPTAAALVQYINVTNARHVKYWSIGNEPDLHHSGSEDQLAAYVAGYVKSLAPAMRDVDPSITILVGEMAWYSPTKFADLLGGNADIAGTDSKGRYYADYITFHRYPFSSTDMSRTAILSEMHTVAESKVTQLLGQIATVNTQHNRTGANALRWGMTEFNMCSTNDVTMNTVSGYGASSFLNGQFFAEFYRIGMKNSVSIMDTWSVLEGGGDSSSGDLGYLSGDFSTGVTPRSSYYHMQMVADYLVPGGYLASTSSNANVAVLSTSSTNQSMLSVMILNEDTATHTISLRMDNGAVQGAGDTAINVSANLGAEYTGSITGQTTVVLLFNPSGALKERVTYSITNNTNNQAPVVETF